MDNTQGDRLAEKLKQSGMSGRELAKFSNVSPAMINLIINHKRPLSDKTAKKIFKLLNTTVDYLMGNSNEDNVPSKNDDLLVRELKQFYKAQAYNDLFREIPIICRVPCGYPMPNEQLIEGNVRVHKDDLGYAKDKPGLFALIAVGDSLIGDEIYNGYRIVIDPDIGDHPDNLIYAVRINNEVTCKHVRHTNDGKIALYSSNHEYREMIYNADDVELLGVAVTWGFWHQATRK
jgi:repressor LexA